MTIATWMWPVLAREQDWGAALERLGSQLRAGGPSARAAIELGEACEYIEPDRRRAISAYALAGPERAGRARVLAIELGWWAGAARLAAAAGDALGEAEAWFDAGERELAALALASVRDADRGERGRDLAELLAGRDLASACAARGDADSRVMAARFARAAGRDAEAHDHFEAALAAQPGHLVAAGHLLALAVRAPDPDPVHRFLRVRLDGLDTEEWIDAMRACAIALVASDHHCGFGSRLLRYTLERAYQLGAAFVPGHVAMWSALAARAAADGARRELLQLAVTALEAARGPIDRVWIGALAAHISLFDGKSPVVAGAYAEIVAEHAPEHPIVRELVSEVASARPSTSLPAEAVAAAQETSFDIDLDLDSTYAEAASTALLDPDDVALIDDDIAGAIAAANTFAIDNPTPPRPAAAPAAAPAPAPAADATAAAASAAAAVTAPVIKRPLKTSPIAKIATVKRASTEPGALPSIPSLKRAEPVLAALRTPDRPAVPPRPADPPDAKVRAKRVAIAIDLRLHPEGRARIDAHSRDLSTSGLFVVTEAVLTIGSTLRVDLLLPGKEAFTEDEYTARATVARRGDGGYGLHLVDPDPALVAALAAL